MQAQPVNARDRKVQKMPTKVIKISDLQKQIEALSKQVEAAKKQEDELEKTALRLAKKNEKKDPTYAPGSKATEAAVMGKRGHHYLYTEERKEKQAQYNSNVYDSFAMRVQVGYRGLLNTLAAIDGVSAVKWFIAALEDAIDERIEDRTLDLDQANQLISAYYNDIDKKRENLAKKGQSGEKNTFEKTLKEEGYLPIVKRLEEYAQALENGTLEDEDDDWGLGGFGVITGGLQRAAYAKPLTSDDLVAAREGLDIDAMVEREAAKRAVIDSTSAEPALSDEEFDTMYEFDDLWAKTADVEKLREFAESHKGISEKVDRYMEESIQGREEGKKKLSLRDEFHNLAKSGASLNELKIFAYDHKGLDDVADAMWAEEIAMRESIENAAAGDPNAGYHA